MDRIALITALVALLVALVVAALVVVALVCASDRARLAALLAEVQSTLSRLAPARAGGEAPPPPPGANCAPGSRMRSSTLRNYDSPRPRARSQRP